MRGGEVPDSEDTVEGAILRFWSGDALRMPELKRALKAVGAAGVYDFGTASVRELARQRLAFPAPAAASGGLRGLGDPVRRGRADRALFHAAARPLVRRAGPLDPSGDPADACAPLAAVLAMTDDFEAAVLTARTTGPGSRRLRDKQTPEWTEMAQRAEVGMRCIERDLLLLEAPDAAGWTGPTRCSSNCTPPRTTGNRRTSPGWTARRDADAAVRPGVDQLLGSVRLDPDYLPDPLVVQVSTSYAEDAALEREAGERD